MKSFPSIGAASVALILLSACVSVEPDSDQSREAELEEYAESVGLDIDVEVNEGEDGEEVTINDLGIAGTSLGTNLDLPDDFPEDIAVHPDMAIMAITPIPGGFSLMGQVSHGLDEVAAFYTDEMSATDWTSTGQPSMAAPDTMRSLAFEKGPRMASITLVAGESDTSVQISTMRRPE